ncbi:MAG: hypothetical protein ACRDGQ_01445, partial [Candidatus Limnocylindrales bacterium]
MAERAGAAAPVATLAASEGDSEVGRLVTDLQLSRAWLVDPFAGREGPAEIVVSDGMIEAVNWLEGSAAEGVEPTGVIVAPGFIDLHAHLREPGFE